MKKTKGSVQHPRAGSSEELPVAGCELRVGKAFNPQLATRNTQQSLRPGSSRKERSAVAFIRILLGIAVLTLAGYYLFPRSSKISQRQGAGLSSVSWAQENQAGSAAKSKAQEKGGTWENLQEIQESLKKREAKIQEAEQVMEQKEQRLASVKQEIIQKIEELKLLKQEIEEKGKQLDEQQEKRIKDLSRIFEGAPPEKAGSIIAQTDLSTAAEIIMRMDKRKAGQIWGFIDPKLAAEITRTIMTKGDWQDKSSARRSSGQ